MIEIILFIAAVMAWDSLKKALRGPKKFDVKFREPKLQKASCGCLFESNSLLIFQACSAHKLMLEVRGSEK